MSASVCSEGGSGGEGGEETGSEFGGTAGVSVFVTVVLVGANSYDISSGVSSCSSGSSWWVWLGGGPSGLCCPHWESFTNC